jgi:hypothetical protein
LADRSLNAGHTDWVADGDQVNVVINGALWDRDGHEWATKPTQWATAKQASGFVGRESAVGLVDSPGRPLAWMSGDDAQAWWAHAKRHFDVPGSLDAEPDEDNRTWSAHIWRRGDGRLLVFETRC